MFQKTVYLLTVLDTGSLKVINDGKYRNFPPLIWFPSFVQVTIEVVDGLESHEPEKGLRKENKPSWASPNWRNWWPRSSSPSSSSTTQTEEHDRAYGSNSEDSNFLRPSVDWDRRGGAGGGSKTQTEYGENEEGVLAHGRVFSSGSYLSTASPQMSPV